MSAPGEDSERLSAELLDELSRRGGTRSFPAHAILVNEGDDTDSIYIVLEGRVKVFAMSDAGRQIVLAELGPGQTFGELALDGEARSASVQAMAATRCCVVPAAQLKAFLAEHPEFAWHLTRQLMHMVRRLTAQVKSLALQDVYGRVARLLAESSDLRDGVQVVRHKLTQQDIADRVGASREMVNRIMKELSAGGYLSVDAGHRIVVHRRLPPAW